MKRKAYAYVRSHRRRWGLTQRELALLVGLATATAISKIEKSKRAPTAATIIACGIVFGIPPDEIFPSLHEEIEQAVLASAAMLRDQLLGQTDALSVRKCALLDQILARIITRNQPPPP